MAHSVLKELGPRLREAPGANCVLGRPDLLHWLQNLALDQPDEEYSECYAVLAQLLYSSPANLTTWPMPERPTSQSPVYFEPAFENPEYNDKYNTAKDEAEEEMAEWFALWALRNVERYKSFVIVALAPQATKKRWTEKWGHLSVIDPITYEKESRDAERKKRDHEERERKRREMKQVL